MKIQNFQQLAVSDGRRALLAIADAGLEAIDTTAAMRELLRVQGNVLVIGNETANLADVGKLVFIAVGKCAAEAATAAEATLGDRITRGVVVDVKVCPESKRLKTFCGTHPLPSDENLRATEAIVAALTGLTERDLVVFVISGGGSTLLFLPEDKTDRDEARIVTALMDAGATIEETNIVRKHLSLARGGYLAKYAYPARVVSLIFSDVPANDISFIASGPTVKDVTTVDDAAAVLAKLHILQTCNMEKCGLIETPKEDKYFERVRNVLAVSNVRALEAMKQSAEGLGFRAEIRGSALTGEASVVGRMVAEALHAAPAKTVLLWGGETTVTVHGKGRGGRNLEVSASALRFVRDGEEILSLASDGHDNGPYAGAICDTMTKKAIGDAGLDLEASLRENDTYTLFEKAGQYLMTGPTGSNVSDVIIALKT